LSHGGREVFVTISPLEHKLKCISLLERGEIVSFTGIIWTAREEYQNVIPPTPFIVDKVGYQCI